MAPTPSETTAFKVHAFEVNRLLLWSKSDSTWVWRLSSLDGNQTRVVTRIHAFRDWRHPLSALLAVLLMEFGDYAMCRRMMLGIKTRADAERWLAPNLAYDPACDECYFAVQSFHQQRKSRVE